MSKITINTNDWISIPQAAEIRGTSRQAITKLVGKGRFKTIVVGGYTLVNRKDVETFEPVNTGRPKKRTTSHPPK
jgi:hypothetical protein